MAGVSSTVPCARPKVEVVLHANGLPGCFSVTCQVPGCGWTYGTAPYVACKTDAQAQAVTHRKLHRAAVPAVELSRGERGFVATCACGWRSFDGDETSKESVEFARVGHLRHEHGLVSCS